MGLGVRLTLRLGGSAAGKAKVVFGLAEGLGVRLTLRLGGSAAGKAKVVFGLAEGLGVRLTLRLGGRPQGKLRRPLWACGGSFWRRGRATLMGGGSGAIYCNRRAFGWLFPVADPRASAALGGVFSKGESCNVRHCFYLVTAKP